jgi:hypothetical protein
LEEFRNQEGVIMNNSQHKKILEEYLSLRFVFKFGMIGGIILVLIGIVCGIFFPNINYNYMRTMFYGIGIYWGCLGFFMWTDSKVHKLERRVVPYWDEELEDEKIADKRKKTS